MPRLTTSVWLRSVATAVPPHEMAQRDAARAAHKGFAGRFPDFERLAKVFESSGIKNRYTVRPIDWYLKPLGWPERGEAYIEAASALFLEAATKALDKAGVKAADVDVVVTVSSTGIATPSLEARLAAQLGFRTDIQRVPVFGLGCAGGTSGLGIAADLAAARPGSTVLIVAVELCTLAFRLDELTKANIVATALFSDGAAACVLTSGGDGEIEIEMSGQHTWRDTLDIMGWKVDPQGLGVIFDRDIPPFAEANVGAAIRTILASGGLQRDDVTRFICHPGGVKVIEALESALALPEGTLRIEREVLAGYGNMSAPTVMFVLERALAEGIPERGLLTAMGPGFTASCVSLRRAS